MGIKVDRNGCTASCDNCKYALGSGTIRPGFFRRWLVKDKGWKIFKSWECWCSDPTCQVKYKSRRRERRKELRDLRKENA